MRCASNLLQIFCGLLATLLAVIAEGAPPKRLTGESLRSDLDAPLVATWSGLPLRDLLARIAQSRQIAIWLDRRIDPDQRIDYTADNVPLHLALEQICEKFHGGVSVVGSVVYIAPNRSAAQLATLAAIKRAEMGRLPPARSRKLLSEKEWQWPELSQPRELVVRLMREGDVVPDNLEAAVPHDLWPEVILPPTAWADRLTLVLAGFGLTYTISQDGQTVVFEPWPEKLAYSASYPTTGDVHAQVERLQDRLPDAQLRAASGRIHVTGRFEDHELVKQLLSNKRPPRVGKQGSPKPGNSDKTFTLNVERQPLGPTAKTIAQRIGAQLEIAPDLDGRLTQAITFKVEDVSFEELWRALGKAADVQVTIQGTRVRLFQGK